MQKLNNTSYSYGKTVRQTKSNYKDTPCPQGMPWPITPHQVAQVGNNILSSAIKAKRN